MELYPYQQTSVDWLAQKRHALLAHEMGLGKSAITLVAARDLHKVLIICPAMLRENWKAEIKLWNISSLFEVVSYDYATTNKKKLLLIDWDLVILDEAHFLKNRTSKRCKAILGKGGLVHKAKKVWALTGTPTPNNASELWPLMYTFGWTTLKYNEFIRTYCDVQETLWGTQILGSNMNKVKQLRQQLEPHMLRYKIDDVIPDLPQVIFSTQTVKAGEIDLLTTDFFNWAYPVDRQEDLKRTLSEARQMLSTVTDTAGKGAVKILEGFKDGLNPTLATYRKWNAGLKVDAVAELVAEELDNKAYEKLVIVAHHKIAIHGLQLKLKKYRPVTLYGGTPDNKRHKHVTEFNTDPRCKIIIIGITAAGFGINLTAAHHMIFVEQDWVPGNNAQVVGRCRRIGQTKPVQVRLITLDDEIDRKITGILRRKLQDDVLAYEDADELLPEIENDKAD
jgi:SWI/SNF-related matrix-associated actin-dependent regulator of chromatin subfamily A-like protein 1